MYVSLIDPYTAANASRLGSDTDRDTLALLQEAVAKTNLVLNDTDGDGLSNAWEVKYCSVSVLPLLMLQMMVRLLPTQMGMV